MQPPSIAPEAAGTFLLTPQTADHFFNYNGAGYEAPPTLYKLRWFVAAAPGRYRVEIDVNAPQRQPQLDLVVDGHREPLMVPHFDAGSVTIKTLNRILPKNFALRGSQSALPVSIELTPPEPFLKGTSLPIEVRAVRLFPQN